MVALSAETWEISMSALSQHSACNTVWDILSPIRVAGLTVGIFWIQGENWGWPLQNYRHGTNHTLHSLKNPGRQPHFFNALLSYCTIFFGSKKSNPSHIDIVWHQYVGTGVCSQKKMDLLQAVGIVQLKLSETMERKNKVFQTIQAHSKEGMSTKHVLQTRALHQSVLFLCWTERNSSKSVRNMPSVGVSWIAFLICYPTFCLQFFWPPLLPHRTCRFQKPFCLKDPFRREICLFLTTFSINA